MIDANDRYGVEKKQKKLLKMLKEFNDFCIDNNIKYSIIGGTLLGAVRENGFIPWDDDADVLMDRENFKELKRHIKEFDNYYIVEPLWVYKIIDKSQYKTEGINNNSVCIDIFIADREPYGIIKRKTKVIVLKILQGMLKTTINEKKDYTFFEKTALLITRLLGSFFTRREKQRIYTSVSIWGNDKKNHKMMICNDIYHSISCRYDAELMDEYRFVDFEDTKLMAIKRWDNYLNEQYGDYMIPVREEH